jgi:hypothetical protein
MADIALSANASPDAIKAQFAVQFAGYTLGEDVEACQPLCLDSVTRKLWKFNSASAAAQRVIFAGFASRKGKAGQPMTVYGVGAAFHASEAALLVPGNVYFLSATPGVYGDAATAVDAQGALYAISRTDLMVIRQGKLA